MFQNNLLTQDLSIIQKIKNVDYLLLVCIFILSLISLISMYSTDGGQILYHSQSHIKFLIFFPMMIILSFFNIKFWHYFGYLFYLIVLALLIWASLYGIKASGSQRWINLYFINIQPSELMKVAIILCFAKYYHRIQLEEVNSFNQLCSSI